MHCARPPDDVAHAFVMNHCIKYNNRIHSPSTGYHSNNISAEQKVFYLKKEVPDDDRNFINTYMSKSSK